jgi:hypothetical protein
MLAWVRRGGRISYYLLLRLTHSQIDTARALGLEEGDAHVIRNAGGRVTDALRSIVISQQLLGTREIVIVHHVCRFFIFIFHLCQVY